MTTPPEPTPQEVQESAAFDEQSIVEELEKDLLRGTPVETAAWRVGYRMGLARARHAGEVAERAAKDAAYAERNKLALLLAALCGGSLNPATDAEPGWTTVVLFQTSAGQASFHLHDSELPYALSCNIPMSRYEWDGHTNEEKWERIAKASGFPAAAIRSLAPAEKETPR